MASSSAGSTSTPDSVVTNSGGPPTLVATTERPAAIASSVARPKGSSRLGWHTTSDAAIQLGTTSWGTRPTTRMSGRPVRAPRKGPSPTKASEPSPRRSKARAETEDVLSFGEGAQTQEASAVGRPLELRSRLLGVARREPVEIDSAVDHLGLAPRVRHSVDEPIAEPVRDRDDCGCASDDETRRRPYSRDRPDVLDILAVGGDDERGARRECRSEAGRHEEVRIRDIGMEPSGGTCGVEEQGGVTRPTASVVDDGAFELVAAIPKLALEVGDEDAEVRVARARVHLGDEEDPQRCYPRVTCRIPRHISSVVPSPHST